MGYNTTSFPGSANNSWPSSCHQYLWWLPSLPLVVIAKSTCFWLELLRIPANNPAPLPPLMTFLQFAHIISDGTDLHQHLPFHQLIRVAICRNPPHCLTWLSSCSVVTRYDHLPCNNILFEHLHIHHLLGPYGVPTVTHCLGWYILWLPPFD